MRKIKHQYPHEEPGLDTTCRARIRKFERINRRQAMEIELSKKCGVLREGSPVRDKYEFIETVRSDCDAEYALSC